ncbi:MAG: hypothetical protein GQ536_10335 [Candidatus Aminicenantes bacterium]|nr:hypothetical protein [Candidatus Aminicenantes bacterium]
MKDLRMRNSKNKHKEKGFIMIVAIIIMAFLLLLAVPFLFQVSSERRSTERSYQAISALSLAEAGIERAIWAMNEQNTSTWNGDDDLRTMAISDFQSSGGNVMGNIMISIFTPEGESPVIEATGSVDVGSQTITRTVRVGLQYNSPIPRPENAMNIFGSPAKHAKLKIMDHDKRQLGRILISGFDDAGGKDRLGLGVEDAETLTYLIESLGKELDKHGGGDMADTIVGDPIVEYEYGSGGKTFEASIGLVEPSDFIDCDTMEAYVQAIADDARALMVTESYDLSGGGKDGYDDAMLDPDGDGIVNLGGSEDDVILFEGGKIKLENHLTIQGKGTLLVDGGKLEFKDVASFTWEGDIIILGNESKGNAEFKIKKGMYDITGDIYLLGSDNGKAKMEFNNDDTEENDSYTRLRGSVLASGGSGDKSKAEFKVKTGDVEIDGFINMIGTKTKIDIHQKHKKGGKSGEWLLNDDSDIIIKGGISLMVPDAAKDKNEKAEIKIHAHKMPNEDILVEGEMENWEGKIEIRYNSDIVRAAIKRFANKIGLFDRFTILSWQEKKD